MTNYRRHKTKVKSTEKKYNINEKIKAEKVSLIDSEGNFLGVCSLQEALEKAQSKGQDLVEINPKADPPVVKIIEYSKFKYQKEKAEKKIKTPGLKTLRVSVRISDHDLSVQARKADNFLEKNMKVKLQVFMKGREKSYPEIAQETMQRFLKKISKGYSIETPPKIIGSNCFSVIKLA